MWKTIPLFVAIIGCSLIFTSCGHQKSITRNEGIANVKSTINLDHIDQSQATFDASDIVPNKETLIRNIQAASYTITEYDKVPGSDIKAERVYAEKNGRIIDICYGLSESEAEKAIVEYENTYKDFYLIARNQEYVYFFSDRKAFEIAGFTSLANDGTQIICE